MTTTPDKRMSVRVGLISDPHATPAPLAEALAIFKREGVSQVWCAGDIGGYGDRLDETVALLQANEVIAVRGNHEQWALQCEQFPGSEASRAYFAALPAYISLTLAGVNLYMVHAEPPDSMDNGLRLFDPAGEVNEAVRRLWVARLEGFAHDVLLLGHTHQVYAERLADTLVINPGSCRFNHSCAILHLPEQRVEWFALAGHGIEKLWKWGPIDFPHRGSGMPPSGQKMMAASRSPTPPWSTAAAWSASATDRKWGRTEIGTDLFSRDFSLASRKKSRKEADDAKDRPSHIARIPPPYRAAGA